MIEIKSEISNKPQTAFLNKKGWITFVPLVFFKVPFFFSQVAKAIITRSPININIWWSRWFRKYNLEIGKRKIQKSYQG